MYDQEVKFFRAWGNPFSRRVEIALNLKGVQYEFVEEDLQSKSPELLKYNPVYQKIPVLVHNGLPIVESQVILEYIDEVWQGNHPIMPKNSYDRAMARFWGKFIDDKCLPSLWNAFWGPKDEQEKTIKEAYENLSILEKELQGKKFFGGEKIGFVDIVANFIGYWLGVIQEAAGMELLTKERYPCLCRWAQDFVSCSIIKENLPPRDRLVAFFRIRIEAAKASKAQQYTFCSSMFF